VFQKDAASGVFTVYGLTSGNLGAGCASNGKNFLRIFFSMGDRPVYCEY
jgi:hypothetical protein